MERFRSDENAAARDVFQRFSRRLIALARQQFAQRLAHRIDPEDVVQSAFKSFFVRHRDGKLRVGNWNNLWGLLALIARRKCADRVEYLHAERRDVGRESPAPGCSEPCRRPALDREPLPEEAVVLADTIEHLFRAVDAEERPVLELSLQGHSAAEIGLRLGRALRTVHRLRERIRNRLLRLHGES
jgi:RNA polymerase sigma-70 factor (ECF subfamily)